jgi:hypothetical protein
VTSKRPGRKYPRRYSVAEQQITTENFFENAVGASGPSGPSALLSEPDDYVVGEIIHQSIVDAKKFGKKDEYEKDRDGKTIQQLVVVLQTDRRNWDGVKPSNVPFVDPDDESKGRKPPSEDEGLRTVFIKQYTNIAAAVNDAVIKATGKRGPILNGGTLGVKITRLEDTGKGNPLKHHGATYTPPAASSGFEFKAGADETPAEAPTQQDPWASNGGNDKPPF